MHQQQYIRASRYIVYMMAAIKHIFHSSYDSIAALLICAVYMYIYDGI